MIKLNLRHLAHIPNIINLDTHGPKNQDGKYALECCMFVHMTSNIHNYNKGDFMIYSVIYEMISKDTVTCQSVLRSGLILSATRYQSTLLKIHETF